MAVLLVLCIIHLPARGQDAAADNGQRPVDRELLDMKLELLNSRIELFHSQLEVWESKPLELEQRLMAVDRKIQQLEFDPVALNNRLYNMELMMEEYRQQEETRNQTAREEKKVMDRFRPDSVPADPFRSAISLNPVRLAEGTFHITYEHALTPRLSLELGGLATYATEEGMSGYYMSNQKLMYFNDALSSFIPYNDKNISGYGVEWRLKNYLLTEVYRRQRAPVGLYAAPGILFRRLWLSGISEYYLEDEWTTEEVTRLLNIYAVEGIVGWKFSLLKVLFVDVHAGGLIRLARYDDESRFTRYKSLGNIDFSGVMPTAGINIGILK